MCVCGLWERVCSFPVFAHVDRFYHAELLLHRPSYGDASASRHHGTAFRTNPTDCARAIGRVATQEELKHVGRGDGEQEHQIRVVSFSGVAKDLVDIGYQ